MNVFGKYSTPFHSCSAIISCFCFWKTIVFVFIFWNITQPWRNLLQNGNQSGGEWMECLTWDKVVGGNTDHTIIHLLFRVTFCRHKTNLKSRDSCSEMVQTSCPQSFLIPGPVKQWWIFSGPVLYISRYSL
jgi:hypothetical protein